MCRFKCRSVWVGKWLEWKVSRTARFPARFPARLLKIYWLWPMYSIIILLDSMWKLSFNFYKNNFRAEWIINKKKWQKRCLCSSNISKIFNREYGRRWLWWHIEDMNVVLIDSSNLRKMGMKPRNKNLIHSHSHVAYNPITTLFSVVLTWMVSMKTQLCSLIVSLIVFYHLL